VAATRVAHPQAVAFGPVPSRRLGRSLGINHIPAKHCSYSCVYCQVGRTRRREISRRSFLPPCHVVDEITLRVDACRSQGVPVDYLTFVPDGEPTLDLHLGRELRALRALRLPLAVLTNGSLLDREDVRADLELAELVSVKVDAGDEATWRRIDRPASGLRFDRMIAGWVEFARRYRGRLVTETMLVAGVNDSPGALAATAGLLAELRPERCFLTVPTRPPAEPWVRPPDGRTLARALEIVSARCPAVELLAAPEPGSFDRTGDPVEDLLAILAVHPMRESVARDFLEAGSELAALDRLLAAKRVERVEFGGEAFLVRTRERAIGRQPHRIPGGDP
jgi:wyosine [tRNA(Phe)-imidazoG37] synthetase (radical SAM superfamily)